MVAGWCSVIIKHPRRVASNDKHGMSTTLTPKETKYISHHLECINSYNNYCTRSNCSLSPLELSLGGTECAKLWGGPS